MIYRKFQEGSCKDPVTWASRLSETTWYKKVGDVEPNLQMHICIYKCIHCIKPNTKQWL